MEGLNERQRLFVMYYAGNATDAARKAGYKGSDSTLGQMGHALLKNPKVLNAIRQRNDEKAKHDIATRQERQAFWTEVMRDDNREMGWRLRASELLGKSEADFTEKIDLNATLDVADQLRKARERAALKSKA
jgi:phage terminase small subunit